MMPPVKITRSVHIPDAMRMSRYLKAPELGPKILFFSGGTALNQVCRVLKHYTHNSIHLVTPFDSGGSSAKLRQAFNMPAIGDLRSRLMALADETVLGHPEIYRLFTHRLSNQHYSDAPNALNTQLMRLIDASDPLVSDIAEPMRSLICNQLQFFYDQMPADFDLQGASIGNLILAGGYLNNHENLDQIIFLFSKLVNVHGLVRAIVNDNLHLAAHLSDGQTIVGQHNLTGKEVAPLSSPIQSLFLTHHLNNTNATSAQLQSKNRQLIEKAELICYPMGSFYSSLMANLLPCGVAQAVVQNQNSKIYIPNLGCDPEQVGITLERSISILLSTLQDNLTAIAPVSKLLNIVLLDSKNGHYAGGIPLRYLNKIGVQVIDIQLVDPDHPNQYDANLLVAALMSLI